MVGTDIATPVAAPRAEGLQQLESLLLQFNVRLAFGRSRLTGQPVIRLVDSDTGYPWRQVTGPMTTALAGLAAQLGRQVGTR